MRTQAQETVSSLFNSNISNKDLVFEFNLFHRSVEQKLWSTEYYCEQLVSQNLYQFLLLPSESDIQSPVPITVQDPLLDVVESYCRHLNLLLDGFFMNSVSVLDTLAHEISTLYCLPQKPNKIYIVGIKNMLADSHPNSRVRALLDNQLSQPWFTEFEPFRHCTTHESLIRYDDIKFSYDDVTGRYRLLRGIKLPDNPQVRPFTYNRNRLASKYCESTFRKIQWLVAKVYESVLRDIRRNGNVLPIPTA